ncbi:MAG: glycosyltransferase family 4 protein [Erysipelotrichia bacterium]|jgi:1,2-diacylglycerol 3-alpha-glucosyltransferase|nr:glycosyltransferase [Bacilli bacterium]NMV82416.1 glycosyltransferase family 4 protein [Erysipelotrichia bacterium]
MNIALFSDTYPPEINGVATSTRSLFNTLVAHGHQVLVITTNATSKEVTYIDGILRIPGAELKKLYGYRMSWIFNSKAMKIIRAFQPDVVHIQTDAGIGIFGHIVTRLLKLPKVYTYHTMYEDYTHYATKGYFDRFAKSAVRTFARSIISGVDEFIIPSVKTKDYMRYIGVDTYINVVPTGTDFSKYSLAKIEPKKMNELISKYKPDASIATLVVLGRVAKEKSIDVCLKSYAAFLKTKPRRKTQLIVVGGGPALEELKLLAEELGISKFTTFVGRVSPDEVQYFYRLGDYFLCASLSETQGLTFMEAMASDLVVITRYDANLIGVINDGETGFFYQGPDDFPTILEKVLALTKNQVKTITKKAKDGIKPYSIETFYQNIIKVYKRAIRKKW